MPFHPVFGFIRLSFAKGVSAVQNIAEVASGSVCMFVYVKCFLRCVLAMRAYVPI